MSSTGPTKQEIEAVFTRLRSQATNKSCFDCNAKNPTWSSVTYGVFICIDCSAVHRSLGVHLTFVRSTNLDTNWTWQQLRQMQLGGNANASQFFRQHNCNTTDAQQKYNSRAAQLYRDKLAKSAQNAMSVHGTKLHLDNYAEKSTENDTNKKEDDFFAECTNDNQDLFGFENNNLETLVTEKFETSIQKSETKSSTTSSSTFSSEITGAPSVDFLNSVVTSEASKSTIGVRKIQPKKSGLGARKGGLGATKVKTSFAEIEEKANLANNFKSETVPEKKLTEEEELETVASVRLAYQDLSIQKTKEEEKMKTIDPQKAKQMERLGMGFNLRGGISHSAISDMQTISQEASKKQTTSISSILERERETTSNSDFFAEYSSPMYSSGSLKHDKELEMMGFETIDPIDSHHSNISSMFTPATKTTSSYNESSTFSKKTSSSTTSSSSSTVKTASGREYNTYENTDAQKKFGAAKCISSDQFFQTDQSSSEVATNLSRFQGSNSISSSDYFNDGTTSSTTSRSSQRSYNTAANFNAPDLDDVKESVRQGVTKVAGRISSLANDVMSSIQDKYGY